MNRSGSNATILPQSSYTKVNVRKFPVGIHPLTLSVASRSWHVNMSNLHVDCSCARSSVLPMDRTCINTEHFVEISRPRTFVLKALVSETHPALQDSFENSVSPPVDSWCACRYDRIQSLQRRKFELHGRSVVWRRHEGEDQLRNQALE